MLGMPTLSMNGFVINDNSFYAINYNGEQLCGIEKAERVGIAGADKLRLPGLDITVHLNATNSDPKLVGDFPGQVRYTWTGTCEVTEDELATIQMIIAEREREMSQPLDETREERQQ
jgi:hypothetical protein